MDWYKHLSCEENSLKEGSPAKNTGGLFVLVESFAFTIGGFCEMGFFITSRSFSDTSRNFSITRHNSPWFEGLFGSAALDLRGLLRWAMVN